MIKLDSDRFESALNLPASATNFRKNTNQLSNVGSGISLYLNQALRSPLLSKSEEQQLAQKISRYRIAFQRLILQEPDVLQHLVDMLSKWEMKKLRLDAVCNVALSETAKRKTLEPRIRKTLKTLRRMPNAMRKLAKGGLEPNESQREQRKLFRKVVRLVEPLMIRPRPFEIAPFCNPKAAIMLRKYHELCQAMTQANMRLVVQVARKLCGGSPVLMDMIQEGNRLSLIHI